MCITNTYSTHIRQFPESGRSSAQGTRPDDPGKTGAFPSADGEDRFLRRGIHRDLGGEPTIPVSSLQQFVFIVVKHIFGVCIHFVWYNYKYGQFLRIRALVHPTEYYDQSKECFRG